MSSDQQEFDFGDFGDIEAVAEAYRDKHPVPETVYSLGTAERDAMAEYFNRAMDRQAAAGLGIPEVIELPKMESPRASVLNEARDLITGDRNAQYGPPTQDFQRTADLLTALGFRFADFNTEDGEPDYRAMIPSDIALIMISLKMSRIVQSRKKRDSWVDGAGYFGCGYECTTEEN